MLDHILGTALVPLSPQLGVRQEAGSTDSNETEALLEIFRRQGSPSESGQNGSGNHPHG